MEQGLLRRHGSSHRHAARGQWQWRRAVLPSSPTLRLRKRRGRQRWRRRRRYPPLLPFEQHPLRPKLRRQKRCEGLRSRGGGKAESILSTQQSDGVHLSWEGRCGEPRSWAGRHPLGWAGRHPLSWAGRHGRPRAQCCRHLSTSSSSSTGSRRSSPSPAHARAASSPLPQPALAMQRQQQKRGWQRMRCVGLNPRRSSEAASCRGPRQRQLWRLPARCCSRPCGCGAAAPTRPPRVSREPPPRQLSPCRRHRRSIIRPPRQRQLQSSGRPHPLLLKQWCRSPALRRPTSSSQWQVWAMRC